MRAAPDTCGPHHACAPLQVPFKHALWAAPLWTAVELGLVYQVPQPAVLQLACQRSNIDCGAGSIDQLSKQVGSGYCSFENTRMDLSLWESVHSLQEPLTAAMLLLASPAC